MLLSFKEGIINSRAYSKFPYPEFDIYLSGFIFCRKLKAGKESLDFLAKELQENGAVPFAKLFGKFAVIIDFRDTGKYWAFTDNSCQHGMFITAQSLGSNFLELAKHDGLSRFDEIGVYEYVTTRQNGILGRTLLEGVSLSSNLDYYEIHDGTCRVLSKGIEDIDGKSSIDDPFEFFGDIAHAVSDMKTICALTGGYDSRMVSSIMNTFSKYECFISGDNDKTKELTSSRKAAEAGGYTLRQIRPVLPIPTDESTQKLLMGGGV